jgi:hypothetical protein
MQTGLFERDDFGSSLPTGVNANIRGFAWGKAREPLLVGAVGVSRLSHLLICFGLASVRNLSNSFSVNENPSYFSRVYKELFGAPPQRDIAGLRNNLR